jgi:hypothetical protein
VKLLALTVLFMIAPPIGAQQVTLDITGSLSFVLGSDTLPDPNIYPIGTVSSSAAAQVTLTSDGWTEFYVGPADGDCTDDNNHTPSLTLATTSVPTPLTVCIVFTPITSGQYIQFITATPNGAPPVTVAQEFDVFPTGDIGTDQTQVDVSGGPAIVTVETTDTGVQHNPAVFYRSGNGWLSQRNTCADVPATADGASICKVTLTASPDAPGLSPGAQYWATVSFTSDAGNTAQFSVLYIYASPLKITSPGLFRFSSGVPFMTTLTAAGGTGAYQWSFSGAHSGMQITAAGVVSATMSPGARPAHFAVEDSAGNFSSQTVTFAALADVRDKVGIFRGGFWALDANGNQQWDGPPLDSAGPFGLVHDIPVVGDWDGTGKLRVGVFRNGEWFLDMNGNKQWDATDLHGFFGLPDDIPVVGNWDGKGTQTKVGVYRKGVWYLDLSGTAQVSANNYMVGNFGLPSDIPVVGNWDGQGTQTKVGVYRNGEWHLDLSGTAQWSPATDRTGDFGLRGDIPVVGDWNGAGSTKVGVYRNGEWHLDVSLSPQWSPATDLTGNFGLLGDTPVVGDWDGDGKTKVGVYRNGQWHLDLSGIAQWSPATDLTSIFGAQGDTPAVGKWPLQ